MSGSPKNVRGRPRSSEARQAILSAFTHAVRTRGYSKTSIDQLSKQSGVSRSTIYRWYPEKVDIALDAAADTAKNARDVPLTGDMDADLERHFKYTFEAANTLGQLFTAMMAEAQSQPEFSERVWKEFSSLRREYLRRILLQNAQSNKDIELIMDMIFGAVWYRMMSAHAPLDASFSGALIQKIKILLKHD